MNIHSVYEIFQRYFRSKRLRYFEELYGVSSRTTIVDVGGNQFNWRFLHTRPSIVVVNTEKLVDWDETMANTQFERGDGTKLRYQDKSFDIAYSNSVIEHLSTFDRQREFASEIIRVGRSIYVQTPAKEFFVEPHLITPFIHWLPIESQRRLMRNFTVWGLITRPRQEFIDAFLVERRLLNRQEMTDLFPGCRIMREQFLGLTKSYIAVRNV